MQVDWIESCMDSLASRIKSDRITKKVRVSWRGYTIEFGAPVVGDQQFRSSHRYLPDFESIIGEATRT